MVGTTGVGVSMVLKVYRLVLLFQCGRGKHGITGIQVSTAVSMW